MNKKYIFAIVLAAIASNCQACLDDNFSRRERAQHTTLTKDNIPANATEIKLVVEIDGDLRVLEDYKNFKYKYGNIVEASVNGIDVDIKVGNDVIAKELYCWCTQEEALKIKDHSILEQLIVVE